MGKEQEEEVDEEDGDEVEEGEEDGEEGNSEDGEEEQPGVNCTGLSTTAEGGSIALFHSPFEEELGAPAGHLYKHLGVCETVMHSMMLGCHLYIYKPQPATPFWTLVTMGLSGFEMPSDDTELQRCELLLSIPEKDGPPRRLGEGAEPDGVTYPAEILLWLANYVVSSNVLFKHGDGVGGNPFGGREPMFGGTQLACAMLLHANHLGPDFAVWRGVNPYTQKECAVNFYSVVMLTPQEFAYRREHGSDALHEIMAQEIIGSPFAFPHDRAQVSLPENE